MDCCDLLSSGDSDFKELLKVFGFSISLIYTSSFGYFGGIWNSNEKIDSAVIVSSTFSFVGHIEGGPEQSSNYI